MIMRCQWKELHVCLFAEEITIIIAHLCGARLFGKSCTKRTRNFSKGLQTPKRRGHV